VTLLTIGVITLCNNNNNNSRFMAFFQDNPSRPETELR